MSSQKAIGGGEKQRNELKANEKRGEESKEKMTVPKVVAN